MPTFAMVAFPVFPSSEIKIPTRRKVDISSQHDHGNGHSNVAEPHRPVEEEPDRRANTRVIGKTKFLFELSPHFGLTWLMQGINPDRR
jgi:hypothetical protein